jgi:5-methylcytosine-specific restriction protein A
VPGCGFCFEKVYGDVGKKFAHVHHLNALNVSDHEARTTLKHLAIVCANCYAMIHRHGECRPLEGHVKC